VQLPRPVLLTLALLAGSIGVATAQRPSTLRGVVVSRDGGRPIEAALVEVDSTGVRTDRMGRFEIRGLRAGPERLRVRAIGFAALRAVVDLVEGPTEPIRIELSPVVDTLESIVVEGERTREGRLAGFDRRRAGGMGRYLTRGDIERAHPLRFSQLLQLVPSGVLVHDSLGTPLAVSQRGSKLVTLPDGRMVVAECTVRVAIDGQVQPGGTSLDVVAPEEIEGVEIYSGPATIPAEFATARRDQFCGLILIWTR